MDTITYFNIIYVMILITNIPLSFTKDEIHNLEFYATYSFFTPLFFLLNSFEITMTGKDVLNFIYFIIFTIFIFIISMGIEYINAFKVKKL